MALLFVEGFEHYGLGYDDRSIMGSGTWLSTVPSAQVSNSTARSGARSLYATQDSNMRKLIESESYEIGVGLGMYFVSLPSSTNNASGFSLRASTNAFVISLNVYPDGSVNLLRGSTLLGSSGAGIITAQAWNHIELRTLVDDVVGELELRVNGLVELFLTDLNLGDLPPRIFSFAPSNISVAGGVNRYYDDIVMWDTTGDVNNTFLGPARVLMIGLEDDEPGNQWSVEGAATGAAALTETRPDYDASYISAANTGQKSQFSMASLPPEAEGIAGIYVAAMGKLASAGTGDTQVSIVSGEAEEKGPDNPMTTAYTHRGQVFEKDPNTGNLWTRTGLGNAKIKVEKTA